MRLLVELGGLSLTDVALKKLGSVVHSMMIKNLPGATSWLPKVSPKKRQELVIGFLQLVAALLLKTHDRLSNGEEVEKIKVSVSSGKIKFLDVDVTIQDCQIKAIQMMAQLNIELCRRIFLADGVMNVLKKLAGSPGTHYPGLVENLALVLGSGESEPSDIHAPLKNLVNDHLVPVGTSVLKSFAGFVVRNPVFLPLQILGHTAFSATPTGFYAPRPTGLLDPILLSGLKVLGDAYKPVDSKAVERLGEIISAFTEVEDQISKAKISVWQHLKNAAPGSQEDSMRLVSASCCQTQTVGLAQRTLSAVRRPLVVSNFKLVLES